LRRQHSFSPFVGQEFDTWNAPVFASSNARNDDFEAPVFFVNGGVENGAEAGKDHEDDNRE
jgi:hypothetical protein